MPPEGQALAVQEPPALDVPLLSAMRPVVRPIASCGLIQVIHGPPPGQALSSCPHPTIAAHPALSGEPNQTQYLTAP